VSSSLRSRASGAWSCAGGEVVQARARPASGLRLHAQRQSGCGAIRHRRSSVAGLALVGGWEQHVRILTASHRGLVYLHKGWEQVVLLGTDMSTRLGDFNLARLARTLPRRRLAGLGGSKWVGRTPVKLQLLKRTKVDACLYELDKNGQPMDTHGLAQLQV
jgi:hypothetical protein